MSGSISPLIREYWTSW